MFHDGPWEVAHFIRATENNPFMVQIESAFVGLAVLIHGELTHANVLVSGIDKISVLVI